MSSSGRAGGLVAALAVRGPDEPALHTGLGWLSVGDLVADAVRAAGATAGPALVVEGAHPRDALPALVGALCTGRTPVVVAPGTDPAATARLLAALPSPDDGAPLLALPTSGTTAAPRAVLRTVGSWDAALDPFTAVTGTRAGDVAWAPGPAASTLTLWALWHALATGAPVLSTGAWRGVPRDGAAVEVLAGVTVLHGVPAVVADVLAARQGGALPALRTAVVAGAAVPATLRTRAAEQGVHLVEYYGAAELSFVAVDADGSGLRAFPGCEVRVREGCVEVRSPYLALGTVSLDPQPAGEGGGWRWAPDGWAGVGDRGRLRPDGVLEVAGRGAAALSVGGHVVLVADVERVLCEVDGVLEAACVAEDDPRLGQRAVGVVRSHLPRAEHAELVRRLRAAVRAGLPAPARPVRYLVVDDLPRTSGGKADPAATAALVARARR